MDLAGPKRQWTGSSRSSRKRRRRGLSGQSTTDQRDGVPAVPDSDEVHKSGHHRSRETATAEEPDRGTQQPLSGLLIAVSSLSSHASETPLESSSATTAAPLTTIDASDEVLASSTYNALVELCQRAGARTTSQVHKRVQVVVASSAAVHQQTQRVRKAWKLSIPVVKPSWVHRCLQLRHKVDWTDFLYPMGSTKLSRNEAGRSEGSSTSVVPKPSSSDVRRVVDLGCCCFCHESDSNDECPWCVDCGYEKTNS